MHFKALLNLDNIGPDDKGINHVKDDTEITDNLDHLWHDLSLYHLDQYYLDLIAP